MTEAALWVIVILAGVAALGLFEAVRSGTLEYLRGLTTEQFDAIPRERRPDMSVATMFRQIVGELFQHKGHIAYVKGLLRGSGAFPPNYTAPS